MIEAGHISDILNSTHLIQGKGEFFVLTWCLEAMSNRRLRNNEIAFNHQLLSWIFLWAATDL